MQNSFRVSYGFLRDPDPGFLVFSEGVVIGMTGNPGYTTPRVSLATLASANTDFRNALTACETGGILATADKDAKRLIVEGYLRSQGACVQSIAGENLTLLLSSGFLSTKTTRNRITLPQPEIVRLDCPQSGTFGVRVKPVPTSKAYEVRMKNGTGDYQTVGIFTSARLITIPGVVPGQIYTVQVRAIGGLTGYRVGANRRHAWRCKNRIIRLRDTRASAGSFGSFAFGEMVPRSKGGSCRAATTRWRPAGVPAATLAGRKSSVMSLRR